MFRFAVPVLTLAACAANAALPQQVDRDQARLDKTLAGLTPGKPQDCIPRERTGESRYFAHTILYVEGRHRVWRNDTIGTCAGLGSDDLVVVSSLSSRVCSGDLVQTRSRIGGNITGGCALGKFVPYGK